MNGPWLVWSNKHGMWWQPDQAGYTATIDNAGRYSAAEAAAIVEQSSVDGQVMLQRDNAFGVAMEVAPSVIVPAPEAMVPPIPLKGCPTCGGYWTESRMGTSESWCQDRWHVNRFPAGRIA